MEKKGPQLIQPEEDKTEKGEEGGAEEGLRKPVSRQAVEI